MFFCFSDSVFKMAIKMHLKAKKRLDKEKPTNVVSFNIKYLFQIVEVQVFLISTYNCLF